jgi:hypothetical protein
MKPIQAGDLCIVVGGLGQRKSPNLDLTVTVISLQGEHSQYGRIWRCKGEFIKQLTDAGTYIVTGEADFAQSWLQKIEPPKAKIKSAELGLAC